jgi:hypothetical protein
MIALRTVNDQDSFGTTVAQTIEVGFDRSHFPLVHGAAVWCAVRQSDSSSRPGPGEIDGH